MSAAVQSMFDRGLVDVAARSVNLKMTIEVQQSICRDEKGWAIAVSTATLSLRE